MANIVEIILAGKDLTEASTKSAIKNFSKLSSEVIGVGSAMAALTGIALGAVKEFEELTNRGIELADSMGKSAQKAGVGVENFTRLAFAANLSDVSTESLTKGMRGLSEWMDKQHISADGLIPKILEFSDAFADSADGAAKVARATELFGRAGQDLIPLLNQGSAALREQFAEAEKLNVVFNERLSHEAAEFNDDMKRLKISLEGVAIELASKLLPALNELSKSLVKVVENDGGAMQKFLLTSTFGFALMRAEIERLTSVSKLFKNPFSMAEDKISGDFIANMLDGITGPITKALLDLGGKDKLELVKPEDVERAFKMAEAFKQIHLQHTNPSEALRNDALTKFDDEIKAINALAILEADRDELRTQAEQQHQERLDQITREHLDIRAELERANTQGNIGLYMDLLGQKQAADMLAIEQSQQLIQTYAEVWKASHISMFGVANSVAGAFYSGLSNSIAGLIHGTLTFMQAVKGLEDALISSVVNYLAKWVAAKATQLVLNATFAHSTAAITASAAAGLATAWAPAAALSSLATFGSNSAGAIAGIAATTAFAEGIAALSTVGGIAHGGLDFVPDDRTILVSRGERILQPQANRDLTEFLDGGGSGGQHIVIHNYLGTDQIGTAIYEMSRDGRVRIASHAVVN